MNEIAIRPVAGPLDAVVPVPGSKSVTNRALILAALANGVSYLNNVLVSDDVERCVDGLRQLGFRIAWKKTEGLAQVQGYGGHVPALAANVDVGNSGTTARFLTALAALGNGAYRIDGSPRMRQRPIGALLSGLRQLGAEAVSDLGNDALPLTLRSHGLHGGVVHLDVAQSSQFLSALLLVAPCSSRTLEVVAEGAIPSRPYIDMTLAMVRAFGGQIDETAPGHFCAAGGQMLSPREYWIEPDASNASYFMAAAAVCGGRVTIPGLAETSLQGDAAFAGVLARMGCMVSQTAAGLTITGPRGKLRGLEVDLRAMPDMAQTLAAIAPFADGPVTITGVGVIRHHETDRLTALHRELTKLGQDVTVGDDWLRVIPRPVQPARIDTYDDHRMAMAFAVPGLAAPGIRIADPECTKKTFPAFFATLEQLTAGAR